MLLLCVKGLMESEVIKRQLWRETGRSLLSNFKGKLALDMAFWKANVLAHALHVFWQLKCRTPAHESEFYISIVILLWDPRLAYKLFLSMPLTQ